MTVTLILEKHKNVLEKSWSILIKIYYEPARKKDIGSTDLSRSHSDYFVANSKLFLIPTITVWDFSVSRDDLL